MPVLWRADLRCGEATRNGACIRVREVRTPAQAAGQGLAICNRGRGAQRNLIGPGDRLNGRGVDEPPAAAASARVMLQGQEGEDRGRARAHPQRRRQVAIWVRRTETNLPPILATPPTSPPA